MDSMSPQQRQESGVGRGAGQQENKRRMKSQSYRRQSAPSLVITKALTRSKTLSRESFLVPPCPETCPLVQNFLSGSDRSFLLHGHAQLKTGMQTQDRHLFLFTDILVIAKAKSANHFKQKAQVRVCEMWTASCMDEVCEGSTKPERSFVMGWPTCNCVATFSSQEQKERWLSIVKSRNKEEKEKEEPKTIPLRVYGKGINTFAVTKTLPVSNSDSTNEVIRLALQQFGIIGNVKDYQLWVVSKRDNAPYPLIGHEFPFSIQMSHVRHAPSQAGRDAAAPPADRQRAVQAEQLQASKQCQFVLKPRPVDTLLQQQHVRADLSQKPLKRRRSLITWAFWRGSSSHLNELSLAGASRGCLFGQPLSCVCVEDTLPKPVMDMLAFLYHEGSWTRGIFRRPAGARAVRELRDSLDAGHFQLPLTRDHVFIIAGVFKDFLRSIPGSLLCSELHGEWMDVLEEEEEEEEERVEDIKRMICRLPKGNALLLRHLLALLHGMQGNAHENQMTTFNLSVCIAPSMLWPPGAPCSPEVEGEGTKKVCELVKFMIESCQRILGEDPASLFGGPPLRLDTDEMGSDWTYPLTDSSYDSLENELDNISGGSPGLCSRRRLRPKPLQGSLDSVLTLSDCDQDTDALHPHADSPLSLGRSRGGRQDPDRDAAAEDAPSILDSLSLDGGHRLRRRSEPAIAFKFQLHVSGSAEGLTGEDEDAEEELTKKPSIHTHCRGQSRRGGGALQLPGGGSGALRASSSSLSSTSPAPTHSSLDSLSSEHTSATKTHPASSGSSGSTGDAALTSTEPPDMWAMPKGSPPREPLNWGTVRGCRGLHPNSWLKKDRRLSLTQQEKDEDKTEGGAADKSLKLVPEKGKAGHRGGGKLNYSRTCRATNDDVKPASSSPPCHHRSTGSLLFPKSPMFHCSDSPHSNQRREASEPKQPSVLYKQRTPSLSLFRRHKSQSVEEESDPRLCLRRGSEPVGQVAERASTLGRARLPSDPGLKVTEVDPQGDTPARFCLSPCATKAVRDYFSSHRRSNPQSGQHVALALVESRREWLRRCSDPEAEPDFEQLLFAEESYV
ncbi:rho GTPase-activating protein 20-like [Scophthalmus maximus]|uniref:rho GTPase-activating protein 20-like n=1 Tax=Scophthalmus maximus TaxID=52904 RepID=UPI001FA91CCB|nr:rho GTPase-activating protein 20-like [Scophthalmus maximus]